MSMGKCRTFIVWRSALKISAVAAIKASVVACIHRLHLVGEGSTLAENVGASAIGVVPGGRDPGREATQS